MSGKQCIRKISPLDMFLVLILGFIDGPSLSHSHRMGNLSQPVFDFLTSRQYIPIDWFFSFLKLMHKCLGKQKHFLWLLHKGLLGLNLNCIFIARIKHFLLHLQFGEILWINFNLLGSFLYGCTVKTACCNANAVSPPLKMSNFTS